MGLRGRKADHDTKISHVIFIRLERYIGLSVLYGKYGLYWKKTAVISDLRSVQV